MNLKTSERIKELNKLEAEVRQQGKQREQVSAELKTMLERCEQHQQIKDDLHNDIREMKEKVNSLQR